MIQTKKNGQQNNKSEKLNTVMSWESMNAKLSKLYKKKKGNWNQMIEEYSLNYNQISSMNISYHCTESKSKLAYNLNVVVLQHSVTRKNMWPALIHWPNNSVIF